jgi:hypothetical protein
MPNGPDVAAIPSEIERPRMNETCDFVTRTVHVPAAATARSAAANMRRAAGLPSKKCSIAAAGGSFCTSASPRSISLM